MTGIELARRLILKRPDLPKLLYTGYGGAGLDSQIQSAGIQAVLRKPVSEAELLARLREIL
jgi:CheY-like chemotaxis protein